MNDYGMPLEEVIRRLHAFMDSPQHEEFLNNLCNDLIDRMTYKPVHITMLGQQNYMSEKGNISYQDVEQASLSKNVDFLIAC